MNVVGDDGTNGGLWCSPVANTSRPTSSAFRARVTMPSIRSCSVGARPVVGSGVTSPTLKIPNCILVPGSAGFDGPCRLPTVTDDRCVRNYLREGLTTPAPGCSITTSFYNAVVMQIIKDPPST